MVKRGLLIIKRRGEKMRRNNQHQYDGVVDHFQVDQLLIVV
jgi:hypothetical protein